MEQPISACAFNHNGQIFAYAVSYDWSKVSNFSDLFIRFLTLSSKSLYFQFGF